MTRRLVVASVLLAAFVLLVVQLPLGLTYAGRQQDRLLADIERDGRVLASLIEEELEAGDPQAASATIERYAERTGGRIVVTDDAGTSVVDTDRMDGPPRDFSTRPEIEAALAGSQDSGIRRSDTLDDELAYVAVPVMSGTQVIGTVRISFSTSELRDQVRANWIRIGVLSGLVLVSAAGFGWLVARWAVAPVEALDSAAERLAGGDLAARVDPEHGPVELRRLSASFNEMAGRLEVLVGSQRAFVADASHQLRTPLTALRLRLDAIVELLQAGNQEEARSEIEVVEGELDRMGELIEQLLALARSEAGAPATEVIDAAEVVRSTVSRWSDLAEEAGLRLDIHAPGSAWARAVPGGLEQILDNLLDNAFGAAPRGSSVELRVRVDGAVHVEVRDHGPGLDPDQRRRATDRFWRAPGAAGGGSGLGLAIVAELARVSGGTVELREPETGPGLLVDVSLPRARDLTS